LGGHGHIRLHNALPIHQQHKIQGMNFIKIFEQEF